jgi:hypothetical protein
MCGGQHVANAAQTPRSGATQIQLAPAFLDEIASCKAEDGLPKAGLPAGEGRINAKGDCEFADVGVTCHYHSGSEFVTSGTSKQTQSQGELHCILPTADPKSPHVYGAHITCAQHDQGSMAPGTCRELVTRLGEAAAPEHLPVFAGTSGTW